MKIFPEKMKQTTKYLLLIIVSIGIAAYGMNLENNTFLRLLAFLLFMTGFIGLIVELVKKLKKKDIK